MILKMCKKSDKSLFKSTFTVFTAFCLSVIFSFSVSSVNEGGKVYYKTSSVSESGYSSVNFKSIHKDKENSDGILKKASSLPSRYDAREEGLVTAVKNQDIFGACWAFSTVSVSESSLIKEFPEKYNKDNTDFSELHLSYFCFAEAYDKLKLTKGDWAKVKNDDYLNMGGNLYFASFTLARWFGIANEKAAPYELAYTGHSLKAKDAYSHNEAILENAYWVSMDNADDIKNMLMKYGSCGISFYHDELYLNNATGGYYQRFRTIGNHSATLVGWDDNYPKSNFGGITGLGIKPRKNGAWLIKNSYGPDIGDNGYFWVSYEDRSIRTDDAVFFDFTSTDTYDNNYQYDGTCAFASYYYKDKIYAANVFTATQTEKITAISFFQGDNSATYKYQIYKNVTNKQNPSKSGKPVFDKYKTIDISYAGYTTVKLPFEIGLEKGENFAVVILTEKKNSKAYAMCDYEGYIDAAETIYSHTYSKKGQSLKSKDGKTWEDLYKYKQNENFRIKAFTKAGYVKPKKLEVKNSSVELTVNQTKKIKITPTPSYASSKVTWSSSNKKVATITNSGKITATGCGKATLTYVSKANKKIKGKITVTVIPQKVEKLTQTAAGTDYVTVSWKKSEDVTGYAVYILNKNNNKKELIGKTKKNSYKIKNINSGEKVKIFVSAYKNIKLIKNNKETVKTYESSKVSVSAVTKPIKVKLEKEGTSNTSVTLKWNKATGATEYLIYSFNPETEEYKYEDKTTKTNFTVKNLKNGKTYYFVVKARIYNGKKYYDSSYSNKLKVKL